MALMKGRRTWGLCVGECVGLCVCLLVGARTQQLLHVARGDVELGANKGQAHLRVRGGGVLRRA